MRNIVVAYLSGPITPKHGVSVEENIAAAVRVYMDCVKVGIPAFCPHLSAAFPTAWTAVDYETWMRYDFAIIDICTHMLMLPRWETSAGAIREKEYAERLGMPVFDNVQSMRAALSPIVYLPSASSIGIHHELRTT